MFSEALCVSLTSFVKRFIGFCQQNYCTLSIPPGTLAVFLWLLKTAFIKPPLEKTTHTYHMNNFGTISSLIYFSKLVNSQILLASILISAKCSTKMIDGCWKISFLVSFVLNTAFTTVNNNLFIEKL